MSLVFRVVLLEAVGVHGYSSVSCQYYTMKVGKLSKANRITMSSVRISWFHKALLLYMIPDSSWLQFIRHIHGCDNNFWFSCHSDLGWIGVEIINVKSERYRPSRIRAPMPS